MPFLTINGFQVRVFDGSHTQRVSRRGPRSRSFRAQQRDSRRGVRARHDFQTCFSDIEESETLQNVINGLGHLVYFRDGFQATSGLAPVVESLDGTSWLTSGVPATPFPGFQSGALVSSSDACHFEYNAQLPEQWTIHAWTYDFGPWQVRTWRDDRCAWLNGVRADGEFGGGNNWSIRVEGGQVEFQTDGGDPGNIAHVAMLPYRTAESFILKWHADTQPWAALPQLRVTGDALDTDKELFFGEVTSVDYVEKPADLPGIGWVNNAQVVSFTLLEIADDFVADDRVVEQGSV